MYFIYSIKIEINIMSAKYQTYVELKKDKTNSTLPVIYRGIMSVFQISRVKVLTIY